MLLGGATFSVIGMAALVADAARLRTRRASATSAAIEVTPDEDEKSLKLDLFGRGSVETKLELPGMQRGVALVGYFWGRIQRVALLGGMLVGFEAFLAEYDWVYRSTARSGSRSFSRPQPVSSSPQRALGPAAAAL